MPLHGKIVVIKRSGGDGTEFPLAASCLFGRMTDCDIRIQLPQVSKEHCRIDLNENKEVIVTNLSSANPTCINGQALQQSERLKHGDVITIIDRSFRFEYPPAPTPKKRSSIGGKAETLKVLQDHQVGSTVTAEKRISEASSDPHLKVGTNHDNIQRSLEKTLELESKEDGCQPQSKAASPFNDLYQMIKKSLDVKTPRKSSTSLLQTPSSKFCTPQPQSVRKNDGTPFIFTACKDTPKREAARISPRKAETKKAETSSNGTPQSVKKQRRSLQASTKTEAADVEAKRSKSTSPQTRRQATPQKFTVTEVNDQLPTPTPKSPVRRRSKDNTPAKETVNKEEEKAMASPKTEAKRRATPRSSEKGDQVKELPKKRKSGELGKDLLMPQMKKKRVSFGGHLSPELFDKRLPPDSPLRKGATPRRSLCLLKPKESLLRRASVIGLMKFDQDRGKKASPKTPTSAKKSPASKAASPKTPPPGKKSPASKTASPKTPPPGKKTPASKTASPKTPSPGKKTPASKAASPKTPSSGNKSKANDQSKNQRKSTGSTVKRRSGPNINEKTPTATVTPLKTPLNSRIQTPTVQGRFSVSRISTPSPTAVDNVTDVAPSATVTPKIPLRRKSMKSTSKKTPGLRKSAVKVIRRSGISRVSMKAMNSWADIVKFGQAKVQRAAPTAKAQTAIKKTVKKVPKPQTPARHLKDLALASTGHANSPATIVVGKAVKQRVVHATGAAPSVVMNTALSKKDMRMDEDMTGISEMFKTPVHERERSVNSENVLKTPVVDLNRSMSEPSMFDTPEEPGQMTVSPMTVNVARYNSEAVQRLLNGDEATFIGDISSLEMNSFASEQQPSDVSTQAPATPNQKIESSECLTGVKRIMKTPKQESEPLEDLRGKLLKTPKQKPEPKECLTGVKRIMKTPKQKAEPVEDIRGNLLKTPKQKIEQQECLTGVKRVMRTPRQKSEPIEDLRGNLLKTPKQKPDQKECLSGVKQIFNIPQWEDEPFEEERLDDTKELLEMPKFMQESDNLSDETAKKTESSPSVPASGIKTMMKTSKEKSTPVEDMVGLKRLMKTPKQKSEPIEKNFGIKRLMKSPRLRGVAPVEDFEGLEELMKEPLSTAAGQEKAVEIEEQMIMDCDSAVEKELDVAEDLQDDADMAKDPTEDIGDNKSEEVHVEAGLSDAVDTVSESGVDDGLPKDQAEVEAVEVMSSGTEETTADSMETIAQAPTAESVALETATSQVTEADEPVVIPDVQKKSIRSRRTKVAESKAADDKQQVAPSEDPDGPAPVRGRRGRKTEAPAPPAVRHTTRGRNAKATETKDDGLAQEESAPVPAVKPKRRNTKKASEEKAETVQEVPAETEVVSEDKPTSQVQADHEANDDAEPQEKPVLKRGKKSKHASVPQTDVAEDANEVVPAEGEEHTMDATEPEAPEVKTETLKVTENEEAVVIPDAQKKPVRGRRAKAVESKVTDVEQEVASEEPVVPAPVRGRRGRKTEAPAPPAVRQTTRGRNAKAQVGPADEKPEKVPENSETQMVTDLSTEDAGDQPSIINASHVDDVPAPPEEKSTSKPKRGRKTKLPPVEAPQPEPESTEVVCDQHVLEDVQPELPVPAVDKPKRGGRKTKADAGKQSEVTEDTVVAEETKQVSQPPARAKRGRNVKVEEKPENNEPTLPAETVPAPSHEPAQKRRRTRKAEQDPEEPSEEVPTVTSEEMVASISTQPEKIIEATQVPKPRRGARKAPEPKSVTPVESMEIQEVPVVSSTDKPKRGRRGKPAAEEPSVTEAVPEEQPEHEPKTNTEPTQAVKTKPSRARGVKTSAKNEVSESVSAKRACRSAAVPVEESSGKVTDVVSEPFPLPVEPVKRGRRTATKAKANTEETVSSDQVNATEDSSNAVEDKKTKRSVKWNADCEVFEITPLKMPRGRKLKSGDLKESNSVSKSAAKTEEEDLSDQKCQPVKRARRGLKVTTSTEESTNQLPEEDQVISKKDDAEAQPKTRRGRSAKK